MPVYMVKLTRRDAVAERTTALHLEKPAGFQFKPGQFADLTLIDPPENDSEGAVRTFSIASAPYEDELMFATRMRDTAFKRVFGRLPIGTQVKLDGPMGSFTLHKTTEKPAVFLAGGIGITPFRSILRQAAKDKLPHQLYLLYSNRRPEDAAFLADLQELAASHTKIKLVPSMSEMERSAAQWSGERGFINREMLVKHLSHLQGPIYYIAGPPAFVAAMQQMLQSAGVNEDDVRAEEFGGY